MLAELPGMIVAGVEKVVEMGIPPGIPTLLMTRFAEPVF